MGTHKILGGRLQIAVLLPMALSMLAIAGCGDSAPSSAVMTVELHNSYTDGVLNTKVYRVTMADAAGVPMNGLKVNLYGTFSVGTAITLQGNTATAAPGSLASIKSSIELNSSGFNDFFLSAPTTVATPLLTPAISGLSSSPGSGNLVDGTYGFAVTALDAQTPVPGETLRSPSTYIVLSTGGTVTNNAIQVAWGSVNGASRYNLYGCIGGACTPATLLATVATGTQYLVQNPTGGGTATLGFNTSGLAVNTVSGTIDVQSGSTFQLLNVSLP